MKHRLRFTCYMRSFAFGLAVLGSLSLSGTMPVYAEDTTEELTEETTIETDHYEVIEDPVTITYDQLTFQNSAGQTVTLQDIMNTVYTYSYGDAVVAPDFRVSYTTPNGTTFERDRLFSITYEKQDAAGNYAQTDDTTTPGCYRMVLTPYAATTESYYIYGSYHYQEYRLTGEPNPIYIAYTINPKNIADADILCSQIGDQTYHGTPVYPSLTVQDSRKTSYGSYYGNDTLKPNVYYRSSSNWYDDDDTNTTYTPVYNDTYDYTIEYINNTHAGQGIIRITGVGNYTGTRDIPFNIFADVSTLTFSGYQDVVYTGSPVTFAGFTASDGTNTLTQGRDYSISYAKNTAYGEAVITVTGMGFYTGSTQVYFGIVPKKVTGLKGSSPKCLQAKLTWKKCTGAMGFEVSRYNTKTKKYKVIAIMKDGNWQVYQDTNSSLKSKTYKYQIRPFVASKDGSRRYYGAAATVNCKVTKSVKKITTPIYTGNRDVDYAAEVICKKVIKKGMSQQQKVKALYDWVVNNCTHNKDYANHKTVYSYTKNKKKAKAYNNKIWKQIYTGKADCNFDGYYYDNYSYDWYSDDYDLIYPQSGSVDGKGQFDRTYTAFQTHKGGCSYITRLFKALVNHAGMECTLIDGSFINRDGSKMYHYWCFIRANNKYGWYDVDVATSNKNVRYIWYNKGSKFWKTCHSWTQQYNAKIPAALK